MERGLKFAKSPEGIFSAILKEGGRTFILTSKESAIMIMSKLANEGVINSLLKESYLKEILLNEKIVEYKNPFRPIDFFIKWGNLFDAHTEPLLNPMIELCDCENEVPHAYVVDGDKYRKKQYIFPFLRYQNECVTFVKYLYALDKIEQLEKEIMLIQSSRLPLPESYEEMLFIKANILPLSPL